MQSILEHTVKSLHEYNSHPDTSEDRQCTILDGLRLRKSAFQAGPGYLVVRGFQDTGLHQHVGVYKHWSG